jgi:MHS family alpha-ketoglutarate permease-like MFS transporter
MRLFGVLTVLTVVPLMQAIGSVKSPYMAYVLIVLALAIVSLYTSISGVVKAEMFPPEVRALSVGSAYAIANAGSGGTAEYVALWFKEHGIEWISSGT